jgi:hypothetical protein
MMSPEEYGRALWNAVEKRLRQILTPRFAGGVNAFSVEDTLLLCRRQLKLQEFSPQQLAEAAARLSGDTETLRRHIAERADQIAARVAAERYVEDCVRVGRFRATDDETEQRQIHDHYWVAFMDWAYGDAVWGAHNRRRCGGVLGARLIDQLGLREAETQFAAAKDELDEKVFAIDRFQECAHAYRPQSGMKFENFFKRLICFRAGDVVRGMVQARHPREFAEFDAATLLPFGQVGSGSEHSHEEDIAYRNCLETLRQAQKEAADSADKKIAAFELHYKAYLDPKSQITCQTLKLVKAHRQRLQDEFFQCQQDLRELENQLNAAESSCNWAWEAYQTARYKLDGEHCSPGVVAKLKREASEANKTQLEAALTELGPAATQSTAAVMLRYQIAFKALALARGSRERWWKEWGKWERCRLPWVRQQDVIAQWLESSQSTIARYMNQVKAKMRICLGC